MVSAVKGIWKFFKSLMTSIPKLIDFAIGFLEDIVYLIEMTAKAIFHIPDYVSWLPENMIAVIITVFGIVVVYKILGRE